MLNSSRGLQLHFSKEAGSVTSDFFFHYSITKSFGTVSPK